jgi:hypothetical protein
VGILPARERLINNGAISKFISTCGQLLDRAIDRIATLFNRFYHSQHAPQFPSAGETLSIPG